MCIEERHRAHSSNCNVVCRFARDFDCKTELENTWTWWFSGVSCGGKSKFVIEPINEFLSDRSSRMSLLLSSFSHLKREIHWSNQYSSFSPSCTTKRNKRKRYTRMFTTAFITCRQNRKRKSISIKFGLCVCFFCCSYDKLILEILIVGKSIKIKTNEINDMVHMHCNSLNGIRT